MITKAPHDHLIGDILDFLINAKTVLLSTIVKANYSITHMKRLLLLLFGFGLFASCTKDKELETKASLHQTTNDVKQAHEKLLISIQQFNDLPLEQIQKLANSATPLQDLKELSPDRYQKVEKSYNQLVHALDLMENSGISQSDIKTVLTENSVQIYKKTLNTNQNFVGLPCYETWEITVAGVLGAYGGCVAGVGWSGVGLAGCSIGLGIGMLAAEREFEICLRASYF